MPERPNILLIVMDSVRAANVSCYGYPRTTTPHLDALAGEGTRFDEAVSTGCWTLPVHASLFTGLYASAHGVHVSSDALPRGVPTLAERLRDAGYETACFSNNPYISAATGLTRGFDTVEELWRRTHRRIRRSRLSRLAKWLEARGRWIRPAAATLNALRAWRTGLRRWRNRRDSGAAETNARLRRWLAQRPARGAPFFAFINYMECHEPYQPPSPFRERCLPGRCSRWQIARVSQQKAIDAAANGGTSRHDLDILRGLYDGALSYLDAKLGEVLSFLKRAGLLERTAVIVTSDHGDSLGEHGRIGHRLELYEPLVRVPLIVRYPRRFPTGARRPDPVELRDLFATVLELGEVDELEDRPHAPVSLVHPPGADEPRWTFAENTAPVGHGSVVARMIRSPRHKLIWRSDGRHELFDLEDDPPELHNLFDREPELAGDLTERVEHWHDDIAGECVPAGPADYGDQVLHRLRELGYVD
jgi:arylsulfatase A-like enzyme